MKNLAYNFTSKYSKPDMHSIANLSVSIVIEYNLDIIKNADWLIDLGPEGGKNGGQIIFEGTPQDIIKSKESLTGKYLMESIS
jgi:excinuclease UvrABC ATPase subunit